MMGKVLTSAGWMEHSDWMAIRDGTRPPRWSIKWWPGKFWNATLWKPPWHKGRGPVISIGLYIIAVYRGY